MGDSYQVPSRNIASLFIVLHPSSFQKHSVLYFERTKRECKRPKLLCRSRSSHIMSLAWQDIRLHRLINVELAIEKEPYPSNKQKIFLNATIPMMKMKLFGLTGTEASAKHEAKRWMISNSGSRVRRQSCHELRAMTRFAADEMSDEECFNVGKIAFLRVVRTTTKWNVVS